MQYFGNRGARVEEHKHPLWKTYHKKGYNLILSYFDASTVFEAKVHWLKANQVGLLESDN